MSQAFSQLLNQTEQLQASLKRLPLVINFVLIIACAQIMSELIWMLLDDSGTETIAVITPANQIKNQNNARQSQQQAFRNLSSAHLFGIAETKKAALSTDNAPETKLNLTLKGVLAAGSTPIASAIIARGSNGKEEIYGIDDKIPGGITLREIHPEHVILERQGRLETLRMQKSKGSGQVSLNNKFQSSATSTISTASSRKLKNIRNDIIRNPASFSKYAVPVVVRENGKQIGYRLQAKQNSDLLVQAGLKPSDVIISVNGTRLNDMKNSISALNALRTANNINITVKRNGTEVPLNIQLQ